MKTFQRLSVLCVALLAFAGCASPPRVQTPDTVNVLVNLPPNASLIYADRIADAFTDEFRHVFHQAGFDRPIENVRLVDEPRDARHLLTVNLMDWRFDRLGNIECTFTAQLKTPRGARDLGVYSGMSLGLSRSPGWWGLVDAFSEAAQDALVDLVQAVVKSELLPMRTAPLMPGQASLNHA
jgi:hypothetical protein